jgi:hypothetical protein
MVGVIVCVGVLVGVIDDVGVGVGVGHTPPKLSVIHWLQSVCSNKRLK